ncbi:MAG: dihydroorotate oxidase catalytic subunit [Gemmatimonadetes bacterium]|nr:dihydroorotate oxidase catalytic subunit [Gemmatimonadota bacterium]
MNANGSALTVRLAGLSFQNPIVLAAGTAAYGRELAGIVDLGALGGLVTKAVSPEPRLGAPAPRVAEFDGGMINAVGLANPGVRAVRLEHLPWLATALPETRKIANIVGFAVEEFGAVVEELDAAVGADAPGALDAYELNVSCPNVKAGGMEFGADPAALADVVRRARAATRRPIFVKLSPTLPDIARSAQVAVDAGADVLTLVNTIPGLVIDVATRRPVLGFGTGGVSGTALLPVGVLATWKVRRAVRVPLFGIGGVSSAEDALQYLLAGATLVGMGTAMLRDPRAPERVVRGLARWCATHGVRHIEELVGTLEMPG